MENLSHFSFYKVAILSKSHLFRQSFAFYLQSLGEHIDILTGNYEGDLSILFSSSGEMPDILFLDIEAPVLATMRAVRNVHFKAPCLKIILISDFDPLPFIAYYFACGITGIITKRISQTMLPQEIFTLAEHYKFYVPESKKIKFFTEEITSKKRLSNPPLTIRQEEFIHLCATGFTYNQIAEELKISSKTADRYRDELFQKFHILNRVQLVVFGIKTGLILLDMGVFPQ